MIDDLSVLGLITARSRSAGVLNKNLRKFGDRSLLGWAIRAGQSSQYLDRLILSTDGEELLAQARSLGCETPFVRPPHLAQDDTPSMDVVLHALEQVPGFDLVVLLQPTSPFRNSFDIDECIRHAAKNAPTCSAVSVTAVKKSPHWMYTIDQSARRLIPLMPGAEQPRRRQDALPIFALNGAVYVASADSLRSSRSFIGPETVAYVMPVDRSLDIDTEDDLLFAEFLLHQRENTDLPQ